MENSPIPEGPSLKRLFHDVNARKISSVNEINSAFTQRLNPMPNQTSSTRPVNPFASTGRQNPRTKDDEFKVRPTVSLQETLGNRYGRHIVTTTYDDAITLDTYTIRENPKRDTIKHITSRIEVEHTRER